jgi:hypothetical protein
VTVSWRVKVVSGWWEERGCDFNSFDEAHVRFGRWIHSMGYENCLKLREEVERYLEARSISARLISDALRLFCGAIDVEVEYDEQVYRLLKEALEHATKTGEEDAVRSHARSLMELIETAERLKSNIICSG